MSIIKIFSKPNNELSQLIKTEIYHKKCMYRSNSPITSGLSTYIKDNHPDIIVYLKTYFKIYQQLISVPEKHVHSLASRLVPWSFGINITPFSVKPIPSNNLHIDKNEWRILIDRVLNIILHMNSHDLLYGRMILCESIAHRCADMLYEFGTYGKEMEDKYNEAYLIAVRLNRSKQMHSSMYYQHVAWRNIGNITKAKQYAELMVRIVSSSPPNVWPRRKKECEQYLLDSSKDLSIDNLRTRRNIPLLLSQLGLNGIGIELGVARANYSKIILKTSNLATLYAVDRWSDRKHTDKQYNMVIEESKKWNGRFIIIRKTFEEAARLFDDEFFDFIYIDGYADTGQDDGKTMEQWWPKLKFGGIFAIHDYSPRYPKNVKCIDKWTKKYNLQGFFTKEVKNPSWIIQKVK